MSQDNNVNVNVNGFVKNPNSNVNDNANANVSKYERARKVEYVADELVRRFKLPENSRPFMCKVAYKLSEARIWQHYEYVTTPPKNGKPISSPLGLFIWLCKRDGV